MLANISVSDFALIEKLSVDMSAGFSVLTGETGAGKSLILDSMNLFLQNKNAKDMIRHGENSLCVNLFFCDIDDYAAKRIKEYLPELEPSEGILLSKTVSLEGKSSCRINSRPIPFSMAKSVASLLLTINGQNDAIGLQDRKKHISYLDSALEDADIQLKERYSAIYADYLNLKKRLEELSEIDSSPEAIELIEYRIKEIEKANIREGEEEKLKEKLYELQSREKILQALATCNKALSGGEKGRGAAYLLAAASQKMESCAGMERFAGISERLKNVSLEVDSLAEEVSSMVFEEDAEKSAELIEKITKRLDIIYRMTAKYGKSEREVLETLSELKKKKADALSGSSRREEIEKEIEKTENMLLSLGEKISEARRRKAEKLESEIVKALHFLDMPKTLFKVNIEKSDVFRGDGIDNVEFFISTNAGEGFKPLCEIASGGELSRVMLALQIKFGKAKDADTIIFDEIDTGISGSTSQKIGICLKKLGITKQIICVTHSAQVSSLADHHYKVEKKEISGRTNTFISLLENSDSEREIARILSGEKISDEAISNARELIYQGRELFENNKDAI